ncbi:MAG: PIG-L family deacetylase [Bacteroidota bacterium]|nr:PIG-L family deacetylase [Bacteroidota bacterium]
MPNEPPAKISFYVVAHADDWQLFMYPNVYNDLVSSGSNVVFIITTAGDAGTGETYWGAREEGLKSSVRFCLAPLAALSQSSGTREFNDHTVNYWSTNNVTSYFLRLPDGNLEGNGFPANGYQSLSKLKVGQISSIMAVDDSSTYHSWPDFYTTLQTIILFESLGLSNVWINYLNPDTSTNPKDHSDHIATGQAIQAMGIISSLQQALFIGYNVSNASDNLPRTDLFWKAGMFAAYEKAVFDGSGYSTLQEGIHTYLEWCLRSADFITVNP